MIELEQIKAILLEMVRKATQSDEPIWMRQEQTLSLSSRATGRTGRTKVAVRSGMMAMLSGWDCA